MNNNKLIKTATFNTQLNKIIGTNFNSFAIYRSNGLYTHLQKRKHYTACTYIDFLSDIIHNPDFIGYYNNNIELVKCYKDNIFICIKLDSKNKHYYIATMFDIKRSKIDSYLKSGRLKKVNL